MKRFAVAPLAVAAVTTALLGLGAGARPALAADHYIQMRVLAYLPVNQPATIGLDGVVAPPAEFVDSSWIEVVALPASAGECPSDAVSAGSLAEQIGQLLAIAMRPNADEAGNFVNSVGFTPTRVGPLLFCAYLYNEVGYTWAATEVRPEVVGTAGPAGPATPGGTTGSPPAAEIRPVNLTRPWVTRSRKRLVCHPGTWASATGSFAYNWLLDGKLVTATGQRPLVPNPTRRGHRVSCRVTAYGPGDSSAAATSPQLRLR